MKKFFKRLNAGRIILALLDLNAIIESGTIKEIVRTLKNAVKGKKIKITPDNIEYLGTILGYLSENNIEELAKLVELAEEIEEEDED